MRWSVFSRHIENFENAILIVMQRVMEHLGKLSSEISTTMGRWSDIAPL